MTRPTGMAEAEDELAYSALHRAGWSVGDCRLVDLGAGIVWVVSGRWGGEQVRAEGATRADAWRAAAAQAGLMGSRGRGGSGRN